MNLPFVFPFVQFMLKHTYFMFSTLHSLDAVTKCCNDAIFLVLFSALRLSKIYVFFFSSIFLLQCSKWSLEISVRQCTKKKTEENMKNRNRSRSRFAFSFATDAAALVERRIVLNYSNINQIIFSHFFLFRSRLDVPQPNEVHSSPVFVSKAIIFFLFFSFFSFCHKFLLYEND